MAFTKLELEMNCLSACVCVYLCVWCIDCLERPAAERGEPRHRHCGDHEKVSTLPGSVHGPDVMWLLVYIVFSVFCRDGSIHVSCVEQSTGRPEVITIAAASWSRWSAVQAAHQHTLSVQCFYFVFVSLNKHNQTQTMCPHLLPSGFLHSHSICFQAVFIYYL